MTRQELIAAVREAIWDEFVRQGRVDRKMGVIDIGHPDGFSMTKVAEVAMDVVLRSFLTDPQYVITTPGSFEIGDEQ